MIYVLLPLLTVLIFGVLYYKKFIKEAAHVRLSASDDFEVIEIIVPRGEETNLRQGEGNMSALSAEHLFASLHGLLKEDFGSQEHFSFEISADTMGTRFYVTVPRDILKFVESQVYAQYPKAQLKVVEDYVIEEELHNTNYSTGTFIQEKDYFFPIKSFRDFEVDPLSNIVSVISELKENEGIWFQFLLKPVPDGWQNEGHKYVALISEGNSLNKESLLSAFINGLLKEVVEIIISIPAGLFRSQEEAKRNAAPVKADKPVKLTTFQELEIRGIENKLSKMGFEAVIRFVIHAAEPSRVTTKVRDLEASFKQFTGSGTNELSMMLSEDKKEEIDHFKTRTFDHEKAMLLSNEEVASIYHLPSIRATSPNVSWVYSNLGEPPSNLPIENVNYMGETLYRGKRVRFGLQDGDDRLRHMYLIGKTGTGKSTLLENMATQDIMAGHGVGVLDPHGETIEHILERIPDHRVDDVVIVDPSDTERPVGLNLLEMDDPSQKNLMASALVSAIKQHFDFSWGPRLEYLLNYSILTLLDVPGTSMLGITRLLEDVNYQKYILHQVTDPVVKRFWETEYKDMKGNQKLVTEAIAPIQNKVNRFLASTTIRNILGQKKSTIDLWDVMQSGKILLINLSKGKVGADNANLLGALLVSRIQFMALQRARISYEERRPFYLYVDEFQNFATGSFEEILSESRKYKLGLYLTHQYTAQLPEELLKAVFGNVGTIATFSLGAPDAKVLANEFAPYFDEEDIISLERFHVYIKLMINGMTTLPFSAKILLPWIEETSIVSKTSNKNKVIEMSRQKYGVDREYVEDVIGRWIERPFDKGMAIADEHRRNSENKEPESSGTDAESGGENKQHEAQAGDKSVENEVKINWS
jgi:hypothetical protein